MEEIFNFILSIYSNYISLDYKCFRRLFKATRREWYVKWFVPEGKVAQNKVNLIRVNIY